MDNPVTVHLDQEVQNIARSLGYDAVLRYDFKDRMYDCKIISIEGSDVFCVRIPDKVVFDYTIFELRITIRQMINLGIQEAEKARKQ